ncbi:Uncharacterised protein [Mesomycoplasma conjunctivae]|uniref:DUF4231 domain-containing protein n=1 Tax=Mesomycoplasma conjunctivae (strain ATCC 25834 / NCTC 10147 / HRC/581) TaxID=572263 RepID=C5J749_MESCH|nr:DUF4231 domain-containing protein [Mesomycoplasma conjunctivae]CAT05312.1 HYPOTHETICAL PROTEIN MCJ_006170 [Mesomycoplasma conjunctivae]VEU66541.1 Uncharacterised protein [Mesomycoplasma conjunctivae]
MTKEELKLKIESEVSILARKAQISRAIFLIFSIALILMSTFNGLLSAYAITKNPNVEAVKLFVGIAIINALVTFVTSLSTTFLFENIYKKNTSKIEYYEERKKQLLSDEIIDIDKIAIEITNVSIE